MQKESEIRAGISLRSTEDIKMYLESWIWRAVESLITARDFEPSPRSIAYRLNISVEQAVDALEGLQRLGQIGKTSNSY
jgi:hypothetical protein